MYILQVMDRVSPEIVYLSMDEYEKNKKKEINRSIIMNDFKTKASFGLKIIQNT